MLLGSHLSIAGGMHRALLEAERLKLDCVQVFTKNQQQWRVKPLADDAVAAWFAELDRLGWRAATGCDHPGVDGSRALGRVVSHASYLINLASPDDELWKKSIDLMVVEIERCASLAIPYLVHHPGAFTTSTREEGIKRIARAYRELFKRTRGVAIVSCLENTVGSGSNLGRTFEELATLRGLIVEATGEPERVGFCFDTCHAHAGGYDLSTREGGDATLAAFDEACGLGHMRVVHLNDSMAAFDSRRDRHAQIGEGTIGGSTRAARLARSGFAAVVNHPTLAGVPMIMETPKGETEAGTAFDTLNARRLRGLVEAVEGM